MQKQRRIFSESTPGGRSVGKGQIRVMLILAVAGLLLWYGVSRQKGAQAPPPAPPAEAVALAPMPAAAPDEAITPPLRAGTSEDRERGDRARTVVAELRAEGGGIDLEGVFTKAEQFKAAGMLADAHLLYFFAARRGHGPSAMVLGTMYDPDYHSELTSIMPRPDLAQAHKWYRQAADSGDPVAAEHLRQLRAGVEQAAAAGDVEAQRLLLQWQ